MDEPKPTELAEYLSRFVSDHKKELIESVLEKRTNYLTVVLEDIYQAHNASAVVRSADCFGVQQVHVIEGKNKYDINPHVLQGSEKWVDIVKYEEEVNNASSCFDQLKSQGYKLVGTTPHIDGHVLSDFVIDQPIALVFGTEETGLSQYAMDQMDDYIRIPMYGFTESFNLSVSAAICLYQLTLKLYTSNIDWRLTTAHKENLRLEWYKKVVRESETILKEYILGKN